MTTTTTPAQITAPNGTFADDSFEQIVTRTIARLVAKGLTVQGCYTEGWHCGARQGIAKTRVWQIDVIEGVVTDEIAVLEAEVVGTVTIQEQVHNIDHKVRGSEKRYTGKKTTLAFGYMADDGVAFKVRLGVKEAPKG